MGEVTDEAERWLRTLEAAHDESACLRMDIAEYGIELRAQNAAAPWSREADQ